MSKFNLVEGRTYKVRSDLTSIKSPCPYYDKDAKCNSEMYITDLMIECSGKNIKFSIVDSRGCGYHEETDCWWIPEFLINPIADKLDLI